MIRRLLAAAVLALGAPAAAVPAAAKDDLVLGMTQYPSGFHPMFDSMLAKSLVLNMTMRPVTAWDPDWKLVCLLCERLPTIENGLARVVDLPPDQQKAGKQGMEITFTLKPGLTWGDGKPVTTRDLLFAIEIGRHPQSGVASGEAYRRILKAEAKDERTLTLLMDRVTFDYNAIDLRPIPEHVDRAQFAEPHEYRRRTKFDTGVGDPALSFGPYYVASATAGAQIVLERNPQWKGKPGAFRRIVVRTIENSSALEANLLSGGVDYILGELGLSLDQAIAIEKRHKDRYVVIYKPALVYEHIDLNLDNPLLADKRVRHALLHAIDRETVSQRLFEGKQPVAHGGVSHLDPEFDPGIPQAKYDPARARALLDEAGFSEIRNGVRQDAQGRRLSFEFSTTAGNRLREQVQQVLQSQWKAAGVEVRIRNEPPRVFFGETMNRRAFPAMGMYAWVSRPGGVPRTSLHSSEIPTRENNWQGQNYPGYRNAEMDATLDAMERELDPAKRKALFSKMQRLHAEDLPVLPLFFRADPFVIPKALKGVRPTGHLNSSTLWIEDWTWEP